MSDFSQNHRLPTQHWKVLRAIAACRTPVLGGHQYECSRCGKGHFVPHSCGNRHCPNCQSFKGAEWLEKQAEHLLPIPYFHVVFTLPHELNPLIQHNQRQFYSLLFSSATATLMEFGRNNLKAQLGITAVLHTWGQNLSDHYHLHCVVTGGGSSLDGESWVSQSPRWLFPVRALSVVFRAKFRDGIKRLFEEGNLQIPIANDSLFAPTRFKRWLHRLCRHKWVVYTKRPFAGPQAVLAYLCRYTHRVAVTNGRLQALNTENGKVTFSYKDYARNSMIRSMTLSQEEFLRRFCLHILPSRFVKIRHYGLLSNRNRPGRIAKTRELIARMPHPPLKTQDTTLTVQTLEPPPMVCPHCGHSSLILIRVFNRPKKIAIWDSS